MLIGIINILFYRLSLIEVYYGCKLNFFILKNAHKSPQDEYRQIDFIELG